MKTSVQIFILSFFLLSGCLKLDSFMYEPETLSEYKLDAYTGELQFDIPDSFVVSEDRINLITYKSGGHQIYGILVTSENPQQDTILFYCHGNNIHMDYFWPRVKLLAKTGYNVFYFDYRGYGRSEGEPTEQGIYQDGREGLRWLIQRGYAPDKFVIYGFSMGTTVATELVANFDEIDPIALILEAPLASGEVLVQDGTALSMPGTYITDLKMDNANKIKKVNQPFLWMHGTEDAFVAIKTHGEVVFKNYKGTRGIAVRVPGAVHKDVPKVLGFSTYVDGVRGFIRGRTYF